MVIQKIEMYLVGDGFKEIFFKNMMNMSKQMMENYI